MFCWVDDRMLPVSVEQISDGDVTNAYIVKFSWPGTSFLPATECLNLIFNSYYCGTLDIMTLVTPSTTI